MGAARKAGKKSVAGATDPLQVQARQRRKSDSGAAAEKPQNAFQWVDGDEEPVSQLPVSASRFQWVIDDSPDDSPAVASRPWPLVFPGAEAPKVQQPGDASAVNAAIWESFNAFCDSLEWLIDSGDIRTLARCCREFARHIARWALNSAELPEWVPLFPVGTAKRLLSFYGEKAGAPDGVYSKYLIKSRALPDFETFLLRYVESEDGATEFFLKVFHVDPPAAKPAQKKRGIGYAGATGSLSAEINRRAATEAKYVAQEKRKSVQFYPSGYWLNRCLKAAIERTDWQESFEAMIDEFLVWRFDTLLPGALNSASVLRARIDPEAEIAERLRVAFEAAELTGTSWRCWEEAPDSAFVPLRIRAFWYKWLTPKELPNDSPHAPAVQNRWERFAMFANDRLGIKVKPEKFRDAIASGEINLERHLFRKLYYYTRDEQGAREFMRALGLEKHVLWSEAEQSAPDQANPMEVSGLSKLKRPTLKAAGDCWPVLIQALCVVAEDESVSHALLTQLKQPNAVEATPELFWRIVAGALGEWSNGPLPQEIGLFGWKLPAFQKWYQSKANKEKFLFELQKGLSNGHKSIKLRP